MHVCTTSSSLSLHVHCESAREKRTKPQQTKRPLIIRLSGTMCRGAPRPYGRVSAPRRCATSCLASLQRQRQRQRARPSLEKTSPAWASGVSLPSESTVPTRPLAYVRFTASYRIDRLLLGVWRTKDPSSDHSAGAALCLYSTQTCARVRARDSTLYDPYNQLRTRSRSFTVVRWGNRNTGAIPAR
jgi:hypothetical protein